MKVGIVWLPNVGKSTLFNALTKSYAADSANFPFCTIEPNVGVVDVKDPRVDALAEMSKTQKIIHATMNFVDIAGLVKGASTGEGLGNQFLATIREVDAIVQVVRHFEDDDVVHVEGKPDPIRDVEIINAELMIADLQTIEKKIPEFERKAKGNDEEARKMVAVLKKMQTILNEGRLAYDIADTLSEEEKKYVRTLTLLTFKPFIYAINVSEKDLVRADEITKHFQNLLKRPVAVVSAKFEADIMDLEDDEKAMFVEELTGGNDIRIPTLDDLIALAFDTVGLMYYFTTGEKETRARTIKKWFTAPQAAGVIHTDFERGFIKAEIVSYEKLMIAGWRSQAREKWFLRIEGKDYVMHDGDVVLFRFNV